MAERLTAIELGVGDVFVRPQPAPPWQNATPLARVEKIRTLNVAAAEYRVVTASTPGRERGGQGQWTLRIDAAVLRVQPVDSMLDAVRKVAEMTEVDQLTFYTAEGRLWA